MPPYPNDNDDVGDYDDEEEDFDDDDDDEEGDFVPEDDDDGGDDDEPELLHVQGTLTLDANGHLVYSDKEGDYDDAVGRVCVHLVSTKPLSIDLYADAAITTDKPVIINMQGHVYEPDTSYDSSVKQTLQMTIVPDDNDASHHGSSGGGKSTGEDDTVNDENEEDGSSPKKAACKPSGRLRLYKIYGRQIVHAAETSAPNGLLELRGSFVLSNNFAEPVDLNCEGRLVDAKPAAAAATTLKASPAAAAARTSSGYHDDEDDDDDDLEANGDDEVDHDELIALHEEAGLPVEQLRKRLAQQQYHQHGESHDDDDGVGDLKKKAKRNAAQEDEDCDGF